MLTRLRKKLDLWWLKHKPRRRGYVIVYDRHEDHSDETIEEYYGYFSSPAEARTIWESYAGDRRFENVKLCRIVEDWS